MNLKPSKQQVASQFIFRKMSNKDKLLWFWLRAKGYFISTVINQNRKQMRNLTNIINAKVRLFVTPSRENYSTDHHET